jgi:hypothetical protein
VLHVGEQQLLAVEVFWLERSALYREVARRWFGKYYRGRYDEDDLVLALLGVDILE